MDIFDYFKKSPDYDPNLSWDKIIKSWEENFLSTGESSESNTIFNYDLESDISFNNALINNNLNESLFYLFDKTLSNEHKEDFTCINKDCMEKFNYYYKTIETKNTWHINRKCDYISKPFLRFVLKKNLNDQDLNNLLYLLSDCSFQVEMGGVVMLSIPKLLFIFLICEKILNPIKIFNVHDFLEMYSMEEIKNMISKFTNNSVLINQKFYVSSNNDLYLDIPLLTEFFSYNMSVALISLGLHNLVYNFIIPNTKVNIISKYIDKIVLMFEEIAYSDNSLREKLANSSIEIVKMNSKIDYYHCWTGNHMILNGECRTKFIFVIVRPNETNDFDSGVINYIDRDFDVTQLPQIINVELKENYMNKNNDYCTIESYKLSLVDLENIWIAQFDNMVIYGIAADGINSMKNWINVNQECLDSIEKLSFSNSKNTNNYKYTNNSKYTNNFNLKNINEIYKVVNLNEIKITWTDSTISTNIEIIHINQNIQMFMGGMTGDYFSE